MSKSNFLNNVFYGILVLSVFKILQLFFAAAPAHCNQKDFRELSVINYTVNSQPLRDLSFKYFGQPYEVFMNIGDTEIDTWKYEDNSGTHICWFKFNIDGQPLNGEYKLLPKNLDQEKNK